MARNILFMLTCLALVGGCDEESGVGGVVPANTSAVNTSPLVGQWESTACTTDGQGFSERVTLAFNADFTGNRILYTHTGDNCLEAGFEIFLPNTYREGGSIEIAGRGLQTELDIFQQSPILTVTSQDAVDAFNAAAFCNFTEWQINVSYEFEGCSIGNREALTPRPQYTVYLVENNQFLFGGTELSFTPENRPVALDSRPGFRRSGSTQTEPSILGVPPSGTPGFW